MHLIDSYETLPNDETSMHAPFGEGAFDFDQLIPGMLGAGFPTNLVDHRSVLLTERWEVTANAKVFLKRLARKYAAAAKAPVSGGN